MSYYGSWKIDDNLTFTVNTHTPATGAATDADSVPSYRVYEDETATPLLTGNMALLDSTNTTGFYSEQIALTAANGFEKGKSYHIYISATVGGVDGTISHNFQIEAEVDANSTSNTPPTAGAIADAVWDEAKAGHVTAGSFGEEVQAHALSSEISALNDLSAAQVNAEVDTALADYDPPTKAELDAGLAALNDPTAATIADAVWDEAKAGHTAVGSFGEEVQTHALSSEVSALNDPTAAAIADAVWDEAKAGHTAAGSFGEEMQSHALSSEISALNDLSTADVNAQVDIALADYDPPTKAELDAGLAGLNDPTAGAIADAVWDEAKSGHTTSGSFGEEIQAHALSSEISALNDLSTADVNAQVDIALADYDPPTKAELDAGLAALNDLSPAEVATALSDIGLDHLLSAAVTGTDVANNSIIARLVSASATADWDDFVNTTDSLQAIRDQGDANWATGVVPIADAVWDEVMEAGAPANAQTAREWMRLIIAALVGKTAGVGDWSALSLDGNTTRISATLDSRGKRTSIDTIDGSV